MQLKNGEKQENHIVIGRPLVWFQITRKLKKKQAFSLLFLLELKVMNEKEKAKREMLNEKVNGKSKNAKGNQKEQKKNLVKLRKKNAMETTATKKKKPGKPH